MHVHVWKLCVIIKYCVSIKAIQFLKGWGVGQATDQSEVMGARMGLEAMKELI